MFPRRAIATWTRPVVRNTTKQQCRCQPRRVYSSSSSKSANDRLSRVIDRLPRRVQPYAASLRKAPVSHVIAFLVLHEITAIVPLLAFFSLFHYTAYTPTNLVSHVASLWGGDLAETSAKFARYFTKKGWFGFGQDETADDGAQQRAAGTQTTSQERGEPDESARRYDAQYKVVTEVAIAWLITKGLLPARIALSVWATPWFAGVMLRARSVFSRS